MLEFENVTVSVSRTTILQDISVQFETGKITSIVGPNGCGKTTLLQSLNGMSTVTQGNVILDGESFFSLPLRERARRVSFLPQFRESAPCISVKGLVEHGRFPYMGFSRKMHKEDREAVTLALEYTGLTDYADCMVNELSGGLQQRAYLAMQLAQNSSYMVFDEPMNYLDFPGQREIYGLIRRLGKEGKTILLVLHDLNRALQISDRLIVMQNRKVVCSCAPEESLKTGILQSVFECEIQSVVLNQEKQYIVT